jgi:hypothetical protein
MEQELIDVLNTEQLRRDVRDNRNVTTLDEWFTLASWETG